MSSSRDRLAEWHNLGRKRFSEERSRSGVLELIMVNLLDASNVFVDQQSKVSLEIWRARNSTESVNSAKNCRIDVPLSRKRIYSPWAKCICCSSDARSSTRLADRRKRLHNLYLGVCLRSPRILDPTDRSANAVFKQKSVHTFGLPKCVGARRLVIVSFSAPTS